MYFLFIISFDTGLHSNIEENNIKLKILLTKFESFSSSVYKICKKVGKRNSKTKNDPFYIDYGVAKVLTSNNRSFLIIRSSPAII